MTDKKEINMSLPTTMRAVQYDNFGGSDLLTINEVPVPSPPPRPGVGTRAGLQCESH